MRVFLAGATGVIGSRLLPILIDRGDHVAAMTRTPSKRAWLKTLGTEPVVCDVYDLDALTEKTVAFRPELVIHQLTDLPDTLDELAAASPANARIRREGTRNLLTAARLAGATRFIAQSIAWEPAGDGALAKQELERRVLDFGGVAIRYGQFYGPGTYYTGTLPKHPRIHVDEAARRTIETLHLAHQVITIAEPTDPDRDDPPAAIR